MQLRDMAISGRKLRLPLVNREIPLVADQWAKPELGSGCVKITPAHDPNDYEVGKRQNLPMINILNPDGTLNANAGPVPGTENQDARERVVADLDGGAGRKGGGSRDRAGTFRPLEDADRAYLADQWFVKMQDLAQSAMDAVSDGRVTNLPAALCQGYLDWLGEKRDWPVSRQLWWGHRIPIWYCANCQRSTI